MPGQALANALSVTGFDIFAWQDRPTLARYLAQGVGGLVGARVDGFDHNLFDVLLIPAIPAGPIGLLALPWQGRGGALRPLLRALRDHVRGHHALLPGVHHLGHVPARGRARCRCCC